MCGVCGIFDPSQKTKLNSQLDSMVNTLRHRGPDDCGIWFSLDGRVALGHRRYLEHEKTVVQISKRLIVTLICTSSEELNYRYDMLKIHFPRSYTLLISCNDSHLGPTDGFTFS